MKDAPLYDLLRKPIVDNGNQLMIFSDSSSKYCLDTYRSTGVYTIFYQGGPIDHVTHIPGLVVLPGAESDYNSACTTGMDLLHFRMLIHEFLSKDIDIVLEESPLIILDGKSSICMANNNKDTNHTRHIARRVAFVRNGEKLKMLNIDWCEGGLKLPDIATKNVGGNNLNPRMKNIMLRLNK